MSFVFSKPVLSVDGLRGVGGGETARSRNSTMLIFWCLWRCCNITQDN